ncbi:hypothetical protein VNO78_26712 [Psophocarpus tetragonolobus]|uniref:Uncharacterized protein n=1 Tax=Psophocarpus tetragonolobus TaxID=3891 RepID=A0AAN9S012_PSOTE
MYNQLFTEIDDKGNRHKQCFIGISHDHAMYPHKRIIPLLRYHLKGQRKSFERNAHPRLQVKRGNIRVMHNEPEAEWNNRNILEAAKAELAKAKKELNRAKESSMQSWLDSEPLIDELERQKSNLANAQKSSDASKATIAELESQLETIHMSIKSKREDQLNTELIIQEIHQALDNNRIDMESLKLEGKKEKQTLAKQKQTLHLRKQKVQTLQLTLQAVLLESNAVKESSAKALRQIKLSENQRDVGQLTNENYYALTRRAKERISRAKSRVSVSMEQKLAAEATRELVLSRLNKIYSGRSWGMNKRNIMDQRYTERNAKSQDTIVEEEVTTKITRASPKSSAEESLPKSKVGKLQQSRKSGSNNTKTTKQKSSILYKMRKFLYGS